MSEDLTDVVQRVDIHVLFNENFVCGRSGAVLDFLMAGSHDVPGEILPEHVLQYIAPW